MTDTLIREEEEAQPSLQKKKRSRWPTIFFVALLVAFGLVVSGVLPVQQYLERENDVSAAEAELAELLARNADLAADVDALQTDQEIERVAREQYGFVRDGEIGYSVIVPDSVESPVQAPPDPVESEPAPGFFERIWRFLSGGDVVDDG